MQCCPYFDCNYGKQNDPTACWHQLHPQFRVLQQGKRLSYPPDCVGGTPFEPPLQFHPCSIFRAKGGQKTINYFHGLIPDTNYKHFECFVMLGTHSEPHRGQMSHIHVCDISALRINMFFTSTFNKKHSSIIRSISLLSASTFVLAPCLNIN